MPSGIQAGAGLNKSEVRYRQHEKCLTCMHFYGPNSCEIVQGNVSQDAICDKWEIWERQEPKDGKFYIKEYEKGK